MLRNFFSFSNAVRALAESVPILLLGILVSAAEAPAPETAAPASAPPLPELVITGPAGPASGVKAKIGDRMTFQTDLKPGAGNAGEILSLKPVDETSSLENQGWYLVQGTLNQNGILRFIASPLKTGELTLPPLLIVGPDGKSLAKTAPLRVLVEGPSAAGNEKPELIDVMTLDLPLRYWIYLGLILISLGILARALYLRYRRTRKPRAEPPVPTPPPEPDHILALRKIDELFARHPYSPENLKIVSFGISEILKEFFSRRFKIEALESTTDEMIMLLRREALSGDQLRAIQILFNELDQFKFTKINDFPPTEEETQTNLKIKATLIIQKWTLQTEANMGDVMP